MANGSLSNTTGIPDAWLNLIFRTHWINSNIWPQVSIQVADSVATEQNPANTAQFVLSRSGGDQNQALTVCLTASGNATNGVNFTLSPVSAFVNATTFYVTFPAGQSSVAVTLTAIDEGFADGAKNASLMLMTNLPGYQVNSADSSATAWIFEEYSKKTDPLTT